MYIKINDIIGATGGTLLQGDPETIVEHIMLDSRASEGRDIFVPVKGEHTDGHRYISGAFASGAVAAFTSEHEARDLPDIDPEGSHAIIRVEDTVKALQDLGRYLRGTLTMPFIGVTGSVGKTGTREMIACALGASRRVTSTRGNSNSQLGVPVTLSLMDPQADIAITELGISLPGEMSRLTAMARPDVAVITNIGVSHIEQLGSQPGILREKLHIADGFGPDNILLVNGDDPILRRLVMAIRWNQTTLPFPVPRCRILTYGFGNDHDYVRSDYEFRLQVPGIHNELNALAAIAVCDIMKADVAAAITALESFTGTAGRLEFRQARGYTVIDDAYNASPESMKAALQVLGTTPCTGRRIAILGDMLELGPDTALYHRQVAQYVLEAHPDAVFTVGEQMAGISGPVAGHGIALRHFRSNDSLIREAEAFVREGDVILVKGSNGMKLSEVVKALEGEA